VSVLRILLISCSVGTVLAGCGGSHSVEPARTPGTVAMVGAAAISQRQIQQYMNYALRFYSWVDTTASGASATSCTVHSTTPACTTLSKQVLHRLLEEQVVTNYAKNHNIRLSASDSSRVEQELKRLQSPHAGTQRLFSTERVSPGFMRTVLQTQLLVKRVESSVVDQSLLAGPSYKLRKFVFALDRRSYKSALDLATGGVSAAGEQAPPVHWVAAYRLPAHVGALVNLASNGEYVGPTSEGATYVVYQVLGRGEHRYGLPAREQIEARAFRTWLSKHMAEIRPMCFQGPAKTVPCAALYH
jgi:hypothetical protein